MAIKNTFFTRKNFELAVGFFALSALLGCAGLKTREQLDEEKSRPQVVNSRPVSSPVPVTSHEPPPNPLSAPPPLSTGVVLPPSPPVAQSAPFLQMQKEAPRVGLILGAGGIKAFAHVGVLKEFARARIPVQSIVGLEWGAAFAGIYAMQGQANEVEWKSSRLKESEIPGRSFLSSSVKPQPVAILRDFLETAFARSLLEKNKVDFACPAYSPKTDKLLWFNKGSARDAIARCLAYPPFYLDAGGWIASPFAVEEAAAYLRAHGANFVIFVNPLAQGELFPENSQAEVYAVNALWSEVRRHANRPVIAGVNLTISINTTGYGLMDFDGRKQLTDLGSRAAADTVGKLVNKYGF